MKQYAFISVFFALLLCSCVSYLVRQSYFFPTSRYGKVENRGCGSTEKDSVKIPLGKASMRVTFDDDDRINQNLGFLFYDISADIRFDTSKIEVRDAKQGNLLKIVNQNGSTSSKGDKNTAKYNIFYSGQMVNTVNIYFHPGALKIDDQEVPLSPIEFNKYPAATSYGYYASLSC